MGKHTKRYKLINSLAEIKLRLARGQSLFYDVKNAVVIAAGLKVLFGFNILQSIFFGVGIMFFFYIVGYIDYKYFKLAQTEAGLMTGKYNPHLSRLKPLSNNQNI